MGKWGGDKERRQGRKTGKEREGVPHFLVYNITSEERYMACRKTVPFVSVCT